MLFSLQANFPYLPFSCVQKWKEYFTLSEDGEANLNAD